MKEKIRYDLAVRVPRRSDSGGHEKREEKNEHWDGWNAKRRNKKRGLRFDASSESASEEAVYNKYIASPILVVDACQWPDNSGV